MKFPRPGKDRVLIEPIEEKTATVGNLIVPEVHRDPPVEGIVAAVGASVPDDIDVKVGTRVLFNRFLGQDVQIGRKIFKLFHAHELLAVID